MSINRRMAFTIHQLHQRLIAVSLGLLMLASSAMAQPASESTSEPITESTTAADLIERGHYLSTAADCYACHTNDPAQPFAGGEGIRTPFGTIYPPNITPDQRTGIGAWTDDEFYHALHSGRGRHGENLYPAMPYDSFTQIRRDDVLAIKAYLFSLPAIEQARTPNRMDFPYNIRWTLTGWKMLNFNEQEFRPNPDKSDAINRGAYLASMAHCSTCHTPQNHVHGQRPGTSTGWQYRYQRLVCPQYHTGRNQRHRQMVRCRTGTIPEYRLYPRQVQCWRPNGTGH